MILHIMLLPSPYENACSYSIKSPEWLDDVSTQNVRTHTESPIYKFERHGNETKVKSIFPSTTT